MQKKVYIRIAYNIGMLVSVLFLNWWLVVAFMIIGVVFFSRYYEVVVAGVLMDLLYGIDGGLVVFNTPVIFTALSFFVCLIGSRFKLSV